MSSRTLNRAEIIGNLGEDPRMTFTQGGTPVCTFRVATNHVHHPSDSQEPVEETEWHHVVSFGKLAEICHDILSQGSKVFIGGRLQSRDFHGDYETFERIEIVAEDMIAL